MCVHGVWRVAAARDGNNLERVLSVSIILSDYATHMHAKCARSQRRIMSTSPPKPPSLLGASWAHFNRCAESVAQTADLLGSPQQTIVFALQKKSVQTLP